jgi:hypothetical protein
MIGKWSQYASYDTLARNITDSFGRAPLQEGNPSYVTNVVIARTRTKFMKKNLVFTTAAFSCLSQMKLLHAATVCVVVAVHVARNTQGVSALVCGFICKRDLLSKALVHGDYVSLHMSLLASTREEAATEKNAYKQRIAPVSGKNKTERAIGSHTQLKPSIHPSVTDTTLAPSCTSATTSIVSPSDVMHQGPGVRTQSTTDASCMLYAPPVDTLPRMNTCGKHAVASTVLDSREKRLSKKRNRRHKDATSATSQHAFTTAVKHTVDRDVLRVPYVESAEHRRLSTASESAEHRRLASASESAEQSRLAPASEGTTDPIQAPAHDSTLDTTQLQSRLANATITPLSHKAWTAGVLTWGLNDHVDTKDRDTFSLPGIVRGGTCTGMGSQGVPNLCIAMQDRIAILRSVAGASRLLSRERVTGGDTHPQYLLPSIGELEVRTKHAARSGSLCSWNSEAANVLATRMSLHVGLDATVENSVRDVPNTLSPEDTSMLFFLWQSGFHQMYGGYVEHSYALRITHTLEHRLRCAQQHRLFRLVRVPTSHLLTSLAERWHARIVVPVAHACFEQQCFDNSGLPLLTPDDTGGPTWKSTSSSAAEKGRTKGLDMLRGIWFCWQEEPSSMDTTEEGTWGVETVPVPTPSILRAVSAAGHSKIALKVVASQPGGSAVWWCRASDWVGWSASWMGTHVVPSCVEHQRFAQIGSVLFSVIRERHPSLNDALICAWKQVTNLVLG